jgi:hypothetical protein
MSQTRTEWALLSVIGLQAGDVGRSARKAVFPTGQLSCGMAQARSTEPSRALENEIRAARVRREDAPRFIAGD